MDDATALMLLHHSET